MSLIVTGAEGQAIAFSLLKEVVAGAWPKGGGRASPPKFPNLPDFPETGAFPRHPPVAGRANWPYSRRIGVE